LIINSIDLKRMLEFCASDRAGLAKDLLLEIDRLANAGAEIALLASNTPHMVFAELQQRSPIPLVSIVEAACEAAKTAGMTKLGLFGSRFTMQGSFYPNAFAEAGISIVVPEELDQIYINEKYFGELVKGIVLPETREGLLAIIDRLQDSENIQGVILGGTELPLTQR
jgi:aspartate racemase